MLNPSSPLRPRPAVEMIATRRSLSGGPATHGVSPISAQGKARRCSASAGGISDSRAKAPLLFKITRWLPEPEAAGDDAFQYFIRAAADCRGRNMQNTVAQNAVICAH